MSKRSNNHKLPPPCTRCKLLFLDDAEAVAHEEILRSEKSCALFDKEEVPRRNKIVERSGISKEKDAEIRKVLKHFRGTGFAQPKLPDGCNVVHFSNWVADNVRFYIGESTKSEDEAMKQLSEWYICFSVLFPNTEVPKRPCKRPTSSFGVFVPLTKKGQSQNRSK